MLDMLWQPAVVQFCKCNFVTGKGAMMMNTIKISLIDFRIDLICKIFNRHLSAIFRHYKNKRPPPVAG